MRDIQDVLSRWGVWARDNSGVDFSPIAAGFKGLLPPSGASTLSCCDDDGLTVDGCVLQLKQRRPEEYSLLIEHYVFNQSKRSIARHRKKDEKIIRISVQLAEGFVEGCLSMLNVKLEME
ncbi:antitermination protein Q [Rahnella victoriana]|uniref:antiterminator Q family protein n=1 Tax=Rahnella victoriana TaxID=1510570 RepID=UPI000BB16A88|nr:antiterminator Q family protein [Rahnella victoriana]PBI78947.1 antitermination protein Q [Rahnella victoriana]